MTGKTRHLAKLLICMLCILGVAVTFSAEPSFASSKTAFQKTRVAGVTAEGVGPHTIQVEWSRMAGAKGYHVYAAKWKYGRYYRVATVPGETTTSTEIQGCETGKTYYFKVSAFAGYGAASAQSKKSKAAGAKAAPSAPKVTLKLKGKTEIIVSVSRVSGADGYVIYRSESKNGLFSKIATVPAAASGKTIYSDTGKQGKNYDKSGLKGKTTYFYKVKAYAKDGGSKKYGKFSSVRYMKTKARPYGNADAYSVAKVQTAPDPLLAGKSIYFLGSSITLGYKAIGGIEAFADILTKRHTLARKQDNSLLKYAVTGTTMAGNTEDSSKQDQSYVYRLGEIENDIDTGNAPEPEYLICQLSSNDATKGIPIGSIVENKFDSSSFVTTDGKVKKVTSVANAIEYITAYAKEKWNCPVIFYVIPDCPAVYEKWDSEDKYRQMVSVLYEAQTKWENKYPGQLMILNLRQDEYKVKYTSADDQFLCMYDQVHPTSAGYLLKYTPMFEKFLKALYAQQPAASMPEETVETAPAAPADEPQEDLAQTIFIEPAPADEDGAGYDEESGQLLDEMGIAE